MAEPKENPLMEKIVSLCKRRGFIFQSSEIYGGINGFWDYGPLGAELKRNVKELWWNTMTRHRDDVVGLDATIIMSPQIWKASGHVDTFSDPMCDCLLTKKRFRADQIEPQSGIAYSWLGVIDNKNNNNPVTPNSPIHLLIEKFLRETKCQDVSKIDLAELRALMKRVLSSDELKEFEKVSDAGMSTKALADSIRLESYSVLLPRGKPPESARKTAIQFYSQKGYKNVVLLCERTEPLEETRRFNPENGSLLTEPRPFNLMFRTFIGPVGLADIPALDYEDFDRILSTPLRREMLIVNLVESHKNIAYLRPETAQAIFAQFKNVHDSSRQKVPFGIAQIGKAFRNEVTPRNFIFRSREFEQMELEFFIKPDEVIEAIHGSVATVPETGHPGEPQPNWGWRAWHRYWVEERVRFYEGIGLSRETLGFHVQTPEELAHYARATTDILFKFPFSKRDERGELKGEELEGIAARSDFDLSQHARFSGKPMGVFDEELRVAWAKLDDAKKTELSNRYYEARLKYLTKTGVDLAKAEKDAKEDAAGLAKGQYIPHVIEPSAGVDRLILALICNGYQEDQMPDEKGKLETRVVMRLHPRVAPIKVGIMPLLKNKPELVKKALEVRDLLRPHMNVFYDDAGAIGRRYRRQDEAGTPFCVTIDFDTLGEKPELKDTVTIRHRDDGKQERLAIGELLNWLLARIR